MKIEQMRIRESRYVFPKIVQIALKPRAAILFLSKLESVAISCYFFKCLTSILFCYLNLYSVILFIKAIS